MRETIAEGAVPKVEIYATSYRKLHKRKSVESLEPSLPLSSPERYLHAILGFMTRHPPIK